MPEIKLTPTSYVVLGLVAQAGEATPYDLKRKVAQSVGFVWSFPHAQLYTEPERLTRAGHFAGGVLNPLVGETKGDDVDAVTRMRTYRALVDSKALGQGDKDEELWKKAGGEIGCAQADHLLIRINGRAYLRGVRPRQDARRA